MHHFSYNMFWFLVLFLFIVLFFCGSFLFFAAILFLKIVKFLWNLLYFFRSETWFIWFFLLFCISFFWLLLKFFGENINSLITYKEIILKSYFLLFFFLSFSLYGNQGRQFDLILKVHYWLIYYYIYWGRGELKKGWIDKI